MPTYEHICEKCNEEFEDFYSIKSDPPTKCPLCGEDGYVKRLISGGSGKGNVELYGQELKDKLMADGAQYRQEVYSSENKYANFIGENRYQSLQSQMDRRAKPERQKFTSKKS